MSEIEFQQLENYLFSNDKDNFKSKLIAGTDSYYYFTFLEEFKKNGFILTKEIKENLKNYKNFNTSKSRNILFRTLLFQLEDKKLKKTERIKLTKKLNKNFFSIKFNYEQPKTVISSNNLSNNEKILKNVLDEKLILRETILDEAYNLSENFDYLTNLSISFLDTNRLIDLKMEFNLIFLEIAKLSDFENFTEYFQNFLLKKKKKINDFATIIHSIPDLNLIYSKLSLNQMKEIKQFYPQFMEEKEFVLEFFNK